MIYLISGGENRSLDTHQWVPIIVNDATEAYSVQMNISEGVAKIMHSNTTALMAVNLYGYKRYEGYGNPVGIYQLKGNFICPDNLMLLVSNQKQPSCKKRCGPQKGHGEKRCEIQGGGQEMAVMVG